MLTVCRVVGSAMVIIAYFTVLHIDVTSGVILHFIADAISIPYFIHAKMWDVTILLSFLLITSASKLVVL